MVGWVSALAFATGLVQLVQRMLPAPYPQAIVASLAREPRVQLWILFRPWQSLVPNCPIPPNCQEEADVFLTNIAKETAG